MHTTRRMRLVIWSVGAAALLLAHPPCAAAEPYVWKLPPGFPTPVVPQGNPMTVEKVALGRFIFYDTRMSGNETYACASCHKQELAFSDGLMVGIGSTGQMNVRNSLSLTNAAYNSVLTWANPLLKTLEKQVLVPMFGDMPVELGLEGMEDALFARFQADPRYQRMFPEAFPDDPDPVNLGNIVQALTSFVRTLISGNSPYDRYNQGLDDNALSPSAILGAQLFFSERLECYHCHGGFNFMASTTFQGKQFDETAFQNIGLFNIGGTGAYPANNPGIIAITGVPTDMGAFRAPTLRNIALTAPYMSDGSIATLNDVIDFYAAGGRNITAGPNAGDGRLNPFKSGFLRGFTLTDEERQGVLDLFNSLTDEDFVNNPNFSDPFVPSACSGDCNMDGQVSVSDLISAVAVANGGAPLANCVGIDTNGDGDVTVNELIAAVNQALGGCPHSQSPTPTASAG